MLAFVRKWEVNLFRHGIASMIKLLAWMEEKSDACKPK